jgi:hypothetical protein
VYVEVVGGVIGDWFMPTRTNGKCLCKASVTCLNCAIPASCMKRCEQTVFFEVVLHMFVPSLSWQQDQFEYKCGEADHFLTCE